MRGTSGLVLVTVAVLGAAACATATGDVSGGDARFDASAPAFDDSSDFGEGGVPPEDLRDAGSGTTWTALYRDLFGPSAPSGCAGDGDCHGTATQAGAEASGGFVCADQAGCRDSLLSPSTGLVQAKDAAEPSKAALIFELRHRNAAGKVVGIMPKRPASYVFSHDSMARIETWIQNGSPND